jgi:hypothetical protein
MLSMTVAWSEEALQLREVNPPNAPDFESTRDLAGLEHPIQRDPMHSQ